MPNLVRYTSVRQRSFLLVIRAVAADLLGNFEVHIDGPRYPLEQNGFLQNRKMHLRVHAHEFDATLLKFLRKFALDRTFRIVFWPPFNFSDDVIRRFMSRDAVPLIYLNYLLNVSIARKPFTIFDSDAIERRAIAAGPSE